MQILDLDDTNFDSGLAGVDAPIVVLDFWADWCHPCKALGPIVHRFADENPDVQVVKVDANKAPQVGTRFGVTNLPAILYVAPSTGQVLAEIRGNANARMLGSKLDQARELAA